MAPSEHPAQTRHHVPRRARRFRHRAWPRAPRRVGRKPGDVQLKAVDLMYVRCAISLSTKKAKSSTRATACTHHPRATRRGLHSSGSPFLESRLPDHDHESGHNKEGGGVVQRKREAIVKQSPELALRVAAFAREPFGEEPRARFGRWPPIAPTTKAR